MAKQHSAQIIDLDTRRIQRRVNSEMNNLGSDNQLCPQNSLQELMGNRSLDVQCALIAANEQDALFFQGMEDFDIHDGVKALKGSLEFAFMQAVANNDLSHAVYLAAASGNRALKAVSKPHFWYEQGRRDVRFTTASHLCRSFDMAVYLKQNGATFLVPDSDGLLPQNEWAKKTNDSGLFAFGKGVANLSFTAGDVNESLKALNVRALHGLMQYGQTFNEINFSASHYVDVPLLYAAETASQICTAYDQQAAMFNPESFRANGIDHPVNSRTRMKSLMCVYLLARHPQTDLSVTDGDKWGINEFGSHPAVKQVIQKATSKRKKAGEPHPAP